jgi:nucleoside 2-deoxyribosyltransferase
MKKLKVYVASSWRNELQQTVVGTLRVIASVYDYRAPHGPGSSGFGWREIDPDWKNWTPERYLEGLKHPTAEEGFRNDMDALRECDVCVLVMPCGRSAHIEAGWAKGAGKTLIILVNQAEPELMYKMADHIVTSLEEVVTIIQQLGGRC